MKRKFKASVLFKTESGKQKIINVMFSVTPIQDSTIDELAESWAICEGYEHCRTNDIPTIALNEDDEEGFYHERLLSIEELM